MCNMLIGRQYEIIFKHIPFSSEFASAFASSGAPAKIAGSKKNLLSYNEIIFSKYLLFEYSL